MEGHSISNKKFKKRERQGYSSADDFTDMIFSWSVEDIFDKNLYKDQVLPIPESFDSTETYLGSFIYPLLEETRAQLCSSMEVINQAPYAELISTLDKSKVVDKSFIYNVKVDTWRNRLINGGRELYKLLPGDILVISDLKPENFSDLQRCTWDFATVIGLLTDKNDLELEDSNDSSTEFQIKSSRDLDEKFGAERLLYFVFLQNITTNKRIWSSLHMMKNVHIIEQVLGINTLVADPCHLCSFQNENEIQTQMDKRIQLSSEFDLNNSQTEAIMTCISRTNCHQNSHVELIWGPPGTGKTRTISVILFSLLKKNHRTLSCAPTNVAVKEVASRVVKLVKHSFQTHFEIADTVFCPLGDILLFGNKDKLKLDSDVDEIYLDYRVKRLAICLDPLNGWNSCIASMIDFMEDYHARNQIFVENETISMNEGNDCVESPKETIVRKSEGLPGTLSFLQFCRDRFITLMPPLKRCMIILCTHTPKSFFLSILSGTFYI